MSKKITTSNFSERLTKTILAFLSALLVFALLPAAYAWADEAAKVSVTLTFTTVAGGPGELEDCTAFCPPTLPLLTAEKSAELFDDQQGNGVVDPGDTLVYTIEISNLEPSSFQNIVYLEPLSSHLQFVEDSLSSSFGTGTLKEVDGTEILQVDFSRTEGDEEFIFPLEITYRARVDPQLPDEVDHVSGQGIIYSDNSPTVVTDDPNTGRLDDPTRTPVGNAGSDVAGGTADADHPDRQVWVEKNVLEIATGLTQNLPEPQEEGEPGSQRFIRPGSRILFEVIVGNDTDERTGPLRLVDVIDRHLELQADSLMLDGEPLENRQLDDTGILPVNIPGLNAGETVRLTYWVQAKDVLGPDLGYLGTNAYLTGVNQAFSSSDDPKTELFADRTTLLLPMHCTEANYLEKWDLWFERVDRLEAALVPLILTPPGGQPSGRREPIGFAGEEAESRPEDSEELAWVLLGDRREETEDYYHQMPIGAGGEVSAEEIDPELDSTYRFWPRHSVFGAGRLILEPGAEELSVGLNIDPEVAGGAAELDESPMGHVYVQSFPNRPVFRRLPASGLESLNLAELGISNLCGEQYLLYIMDSVLRREFDILEEMDPDELFQLYEYEELA